MPDPTNIYALTLECEHTVLTPIELRLQYPDDIHYILCPMCKDYKNKNVYGNIGTAWQHVVGIKEMVDDELLRNVFSGDAFILPRDILRLQPSVPGNRARPFPYVPQRTGFKFS